METHFSSELDGNIKMSKLIARLLPLLGYLFKQFKPCDYCIPLPQYHDI